MYPVPDGFHDLPFFDIRFCLGSDRDHNLASNFFLKNIYIFQLNNNNIDGPLRWVLSNLEEFVTDMYVTFFQFTFSIFFFTSIFFLGLNLKFILILFANF